VPFDVPVTANSTATATASSVPQAAEPNSAHAVVAGVKTTMVRAGDNLWDISRIRLGDGARYTRIYAANSAQIRDPNLIYPGQVFVVPSETN
jgi:nucleoid-associated protein YgaU